MPTLVAVADNMKNTVKITVCGTISALAVVLMLGTNIPIMPYTVPALVGILFIVPAFELNLKWAFMCFSVTSVLSIVLPTEREALIMFIGLLGYYPVLKILIEHLKIRILGILIKFLTFNIAVSVCFYLTFKILGLNIFQNNRFEVGVSVIIVYIIGNIAFAIFDLALTGIFNIYFSRFRKPIRKALRLK